VCRHRSDAGSGGSLEPARRLCLGRHGHRTHHDIDHVRAVDHVHDEHQRPTRADDHSAGHATLAFDDEYIGTIGNWGCDDNHDDFGAAHEFFHHDIDRLTTTTASSEGVGDG
jgi:hypothetical protein